jgi:uncharacterized beta-barrel protein YwiB (DUF1934 family)
MTEYFTPFGAMMIALDTRKVNVDEGENYLNIHIKYGLEANYQFVADCNISISVKNRH